MIEHPPLRLKVWGEYACFTRPEMKAERVSYEVMTPSAARGVLEAIYWKPEIQWQVRSIAVLNPIRRASIQRNEVSSVASPRAIRTGFERGGGYNYYADDDRTQRHTLALRGVAYLIEADLVPTGRGEADHPAKHRDIFRRRVARGQCFHRPYLGCREFAASFGEPDGSEKVADILAGRTEPLGRMLFDLRYGSEGPNTPIFFNAELADGVLHVPSYLYTELTPVEEEQ
jgi:CRISPR-associated protein Cas5d